MIYLIAFIIALFMPLLLQFITFIIWREWYVDFLDIDYLKWHGGSTVLIFILLFFAVWL